MYLETSGDATFTVLIEGFSTTDPWAKGGVSYIYDDSSMNIFADILTLSWHTP